MRFLRLTFSVIFPFLVHAQDVVDSTDVVETIYYLASTEAEGRLAGSKGEEYARKYLVKSLERIGLTPFVDSFIQPFTFIHSTKKDAIILKDTLKGVNIIGYIDNKKEKTILIGAHYDHLGKNEYGFGRFEKQTGKIHYGADDNASGVAGVLRLAHKIVANQLAHEANYIIVFFSGEEFGLHGSNYLSDYLKQESILIEFMLNFDMIGRLNTQKELYVEGVSSSRNFDSLLTVLNSKGAFQIHKKKSAVGASDHTSFYLDSIPVLAFSSGVHSDYHTINDTPDKINYAGIIQIVDFTYQLLHTLEKTDLTYQYTPHQSKTSRSSLKVSLGIMPGYAEDGPGLLIEAVSENKPAKKGGIIAGDRIIAINDCSVNSIYDYMDCLASFEKGDQAKITLLRNSQKLIKQVKF